MVETVESRYALKNNNTDTVLSPQQIVDCDTGDGNQGCNGGDPAVAYEYVIKNGLMTEDSYPYVSGDSGDSGTCAYVKSQVAANISAFTYATPPCSSGACSNQNDVLLAQNLASHGPAGIIVDASNWQVRLRPQLRAFVVREGTGFCAQLTSCVCACAVWARIIHGEPSAIARRPQRTWITACSSRATAVIS